MPSLLTFDELPSAIQCLSDRLTSIEKLLHDRLQPTEPPQNEFLTVQQAAALLNLAVPTLYGKVHRREIPYSKTGKKLSFRRSDIQTWIEANRRPTATESHRTTLKIAANAMNKRKGAGNV